MSGLRVLVLFGGRSGEHEVSVVSARSVVQALDALGHLVVPVGITRGGRWLRCDPRVVQRQVPEDGEPYLLVPEPSTLHDVDVAFPALHGPYGEDGCVQGLFELAGLPYVGAGVEGSAIGVNKATHKRLFAEAGLPVVDFVEIARPEWDADQSPVLVRASKLGFPCFVKPVHLGSSVGISKAREEPDLPAAIERALRHDDLVLVEAFGGPREIEVGLLGEPPEVSAAGEILAASEFYDYRSKYAESATELRIPANLSPDAERTLRDYALTAFRVARCEGLARVDFFWDPAAERLVVNEINSVPGLTPVSMFPRVWEASGLGFPEVVRRLLDHALARHERKSLLEAARAAFHDQEVAGPATGERPGRSASA